MSEPFSYSITFTLNKPYLTECFEQTVAAKSFFQSYQKAFAFILLGSILWFFTELNGYISSFIVALGFVEAVSVRFQKPWWVTRQLLGRSGNNDVTLHMDENGINIESPYVKQQFLWSDITDITCTEKGFVIKVQQQGHYVSASILSDLAIDFLRQKARNVSLQTKHVSDS
ncbi:YcxB family protein [Colwellia sp. MEBiC06753]